MSRALGLCVRVCGARGLNLPCCLRAAATACPNDCSLHGYCLSGKCFCKPGYKGADCSVGAPALLRHALPPSPPAYSFVRHR